MTAEFLDIFDVNMAPLAPFKMEKGEVHAKGVWHQTFHCWVMRRDPAGGTIFLQLRGSQKADSPDSFDISVAGHLQSGEKPLDGMREMEEELGISVAVDHLLYLGVMKQASDRPGYYNREFCHTYFCETGHRPQDCKPQLSEVDGVFEISIADGLKLFSGEAAEAHVTGILREGDIYKPATRTITTADMCGANDRCHVTRYYLKIFVLADLYLKGHRPLAV